MKHLPTLMIVALCLCAPLQAQEGLQVENAWVRESAPTARVLGAFMHLHNRGSETLTIRGAQSPQFDSVEIHQTVLENGMARMLPQDSLTLGPDEHMDLKPGGYHLMLIGPKRPFRAGERVEINLDVSEQSMYHLHVEVRKDDGEGDDHTHHHH